eukprot:TRINITY_DN7007_c0_g4_i1.p1 TRINITY_DN7007_c0_g4~~TRINITY_DN7007_c0_g4_i1.p1  ORF type:complete len:463 (-),score=118.20 TRINITY_DN7007_c0_g4_i1:147-1535(-)
MHSKSGMLAGCSNSESTLTRGDRFIPSRTFTSGTAIDYSPMDMNISDTDSEGSYNSKCSECAYKALIQENLSVEIKDSRVLRFKGTRRKQNENYNTMNSGKELCSTIYEAYVKAQHVVEQKKQNKRRVPRKAERILDAPELLDDYYLNLIDWSTSDKVAVCLGHSLYLWDANTGETDQLLTHDAANAWNVLTAVAWSPEGKDVVIGCADRSVQLWDAAATKCKAKLAYNLHDNRISALAWNHRQPSLLASGSRDANIFLHDLRAAQKPIGKLEGHSQEVCGLRWSCEGTQLASGGNDNSLCVWDLGETTPRFVRQNYHQAAVKALAWCPWKSNLLATGGGTADKCIKFWDTLTGDCIKSHQTESQICAMIFNPLEKELISSHGFTTNSINIWSYPKMEVVAELKGHKSRVLYMAMSPDASTIVSGGADETLRFWRVNAETKTPHKLQKNTETFSVFTKNEIR